MKHTHIALVIVVIGAAAIFGYRAIEPYLNEKDQLASSDAANTRGTITLAVDGWAGYFPLCSPEMRRRLRNEQYGLRCTDDLADYDARYKALRRGEYHFAVGTVDSYLLNGEDHDYPGQIVTVIDESKGGDALVAWGDQYPNLDAFKGDTPAKIAYTEFSPSHHLVKAVSSHFDIPSLAESRNAISSNGSEEALEKLLDKEVAAAVIWEPEVTKALEQDGVVKVLSTADTQRLIVDILIANQDTIQDEPALVQTFLKAYFRTQKFYRDNPGELLDDLSDHYDVGESTATTLLQGVRWATLQENAESWFGVSSGAMDRHLVDTIYSTLDILIASDDFDRNPLPNADAYRILNSSFISELNDSVLSGGFGAKASNDSGHAFSPLTDSEWQQLKEVGTLKVRPIVFASGTSDLMLTDKEQIDEIVKSLNHYPTFRVEVRGHSGIRGDKNANLLLSEDRADAVLRYIDITHGIENHRFRAVGFGGTQPLERRPGESNRAYGYRLPRVEIVLVREVI